MDPGTPLTASTTMGRVEYKTMQRARNFSFVPPVVIFWGTSVANEVHKICQINALV